MKRSALITVLMVMMWWLAVPCVHGEAPSPDSARMEVERHVNGPEVTEHSTKPQAPGSQ
ncbi:MAG: hypothetical protein IJ540_12300 [Prevotella sp.]|nr:hypothetical protein [Prevotella sp.]